MTEGEERFKSEEHGSKLPAKPRTARQKFLSMLRKTGSVRLASEASGKPRGVWLKLKETDARLSAAWQQALDDYVEILEVEADRRAISGEEEPVFYGGKQVGARMKTSDSLLMFRLKALRPQQYKDAGAEDKAQVKVEVQSFCGMTATPTPADAAGGRDD